ncbi:hypothetical protein PENTCL1PPCAC_14549, partial [Pristionchus entomophagus]
RSLHCISAVSLPIDLLTIYLIWTKTPRKTGSYKYLLLLMQICSALMQIHVGEFFAPIPLFPLTGTYCKGFLCQMNVPPHFCVVMFFFLLLACLAIQNICVLYRHQAILPSNHWLKIRNHYRGIIFLVYAMAVESMTIFVLYSEHETAGRSEYLE